MQCCVIMCSGCTLVGTTLLPWQCMQPDNVCVSAWYVSVFVLDHYSSPSMSSPTVASRPHCNPSIATDTLPYSTDRCVHTHTVIKVFDCGQSDSSCEDSLSVSRHQIKWHDNWKSNDASQLLTVTVDPYKLTVVIAWKPNCLQLCNFNIAPSPDVINSQPAASYYYKRTDGRLT